MVKRPAARSAGLLAVLALFGCTQAGGNAAGSSDPAAPANLRATVQDVPATIAGRPGWSTYWTLCWDSVPGAVRYELQTITSEGTSTKLRRQQDPCFRLQVAAGISDGEPRKVERIQQLAWQSANLAYRVRGRGRYGAGPWSPVVEAGAVDGTSKSP